MSWQLLIAVSVTLYSVSTLMQRVLVKDNSKPIAFSIVFQVLTGIVIAIVGLLTSSDMSFPRLAPIVGNLVAMIVLYGLANIAIFSSLKETEASVFTILFSTRALFTIAASSILLQEVLTGKQLIGASLIFLAVIVVNWKSGKNMLHLGRGELYAIAAAACFGFANTNDRYILQSFPLYSYLSLAFIAPPVLIASLYPKEIKSITTFFSKKMLPKVLLLSFVYTFSAITFFAALQTGGNSSQIATVNLTSVIVIVLLAVIFLKEREHTVQKIAGAAICFMGLLLVS